MTDRIEYHLVLDDTQSLLDISRIISQQLWNFEDEIEATETTPFQQIWMKMDVNGNRLAFLYIEDLLLNVQYITLRGFNHEAIDNATEELTREINILSMQAIHDLMRENTLEQEQITLANKMFIAAPFDFTPSAFTYLENLFYHTNPKVQQAALFASSYVGWKELKPVLEKLAQETTEVGRDAKKMIKLLENYSES